MKKIVIALILAALLPARALLADDGDVRVDVICQLTDAGKKIQRPDADHPVYYLPIPAGYKESGDTLKFWQRPPPPPNQVVGMLAKALDGEGYHIMSHQHHPSLVLIVWWGYIAPQIVSTNNSLNITYSSPSPGQTIPVSQMTNSADMLAMTGGSRFGWTKDAQMDPRLNEVFEAAGTPRYYLTVRAIDFNDWLHHVDTPYWTAHISAPYWGHYLDETLPTLIKSGAPMLGRDMFAPQMASAPVIPLGHVEMGTPVAVPDKKQ